MGILVIIFMYVLLGVAIYFYLKRFCLVSNSKRKIGVYLLLLALFGYVLEIFNRLESVTLFVGYFIIAYLFSWIVFKVNYRHSVAISGIFSAIRILVVFVWAYVFNIELWKS